jgi:hypothetical protein
MRCTGSRTRENQGIDKKAERRLKRTARPRGDITLTAVFWQSVPFSRRRLASMFMSHLWTYESCGVEYHDSGKEMVMAGQWTTTVRT